MDKIQHYPDGVVFELTLNGDAPENQPLEMVSRDGYTGLWKHNGPKVTGTQTRCFKWVAIGNCRNLNEVRRKLVKHGKIPEGQWRGAVKKMFKPDDQHCRGIADASWVGTHGRAYFPFMHSCDVLGFLWTGHGFVNSWRWLVEVA